MNLDSRSSALSQISHLVTGLTKKTYKSSALECRSLVRHFGVEAERHLYRTLFSSIDFAYETKNNSTFQQQFLIQLSDSLCKSPNFISLLCYSLDNPLSQQKSLKPSQQLFSFIAKNLKLSLLKELAFALAATNSSLTELRKFAESHFKQKINEFIDKFEGEKLSLSEVETSPELVHQILVGLVKLELPEQKAKFARICKQCKIQKPALQPFLVDLQQKEADSDLTADRLVPDEDSMMSSNNPPDLIQSLEKCGYKFTASVEECRNYMSICSKDTLTASCIARAIGFMARTHTGLDDKNLLMAMNLTGTSIWDKEKNNDPKTWNVEIFINVVHEINKSLHWKEIVYELDHPGFSVTDRQGLILIVKALKFGFQMQGLTAAFPVDMFYRQWKNSIGQLSLFEQSLNNPDIFNFSDHTHHPVAVEVLKAQPDIDNRDISCWKSLELLDTLLALAEAGHKEKVNAMFQLPKARCPDVLALGLIQINPPLCPFRSEWLKELLQIFFGNHPNSGIILNYAWHSKLNLKLIVITAMNEWYSKALADHDTEHNRLSRILDLAQDLKALSLLLNTKSLPFVIDLAVMASRREYLSLDKWLADQIREHGEGFVKAVVQYLHRKLPVLANNNSSGLALKEEHFVKANFPIEALSIMLLCLQNIAQQAPIQPELKDAIISMVQISQPILSRPRQPPALAPAPMRSQLPMEGNQNLGFPPALPVAQGAIRPAPRPGLPASVASSMFPPHSGHDTIMNMTSQFGGLNFNSNIPGSSASGLPPSSSSAFSLPALGPLVSAGSGSPNRGFNNGPSGLPHNASGAMDGMTSPSPFGGQFPPPASMSSAPSVIGNQSPVVTASAGGGGMQSGIEQIRTGNIGNIFPDITAPIPPDIENEANSYFQRIYNHPPHPTMTIDEVLNLLRRFQESNNQRERDVFDCMIKNLFEEYKYFPQYPEKELHITAQLFGGIIEHGLVTMIPLGLALRFVLDAVRKQSESNMFYFGITALDRFKTRLKDYPQYCHHIACIDHFKESFPTHLVTWVEYGVESRTPPGDPPKGEVLPPHLKAIIEGQSGGQSAPATTAGNSGSMSLGSIVGGPTTSVNSQLSTTKSTTTVTSTVSTSHTIVRPTATSVGGRPSIANTTNIDTLLNAKQKSGSGGEHKVPDDKIQDKVAFIFNNLSLMNMQQKGDNLKEILNDDFTGWLAQYLVMKRASIEPNFHTLYSSFLEVKNSPKLYTEVLKETYTNIKILLGSDKSIANFSDRSLLKNLGHWLGLMTLARNKPILMIDLELKPLIIEAFHNGQQELLCVVPFVAKVLESCSKSKIFKPPCPWTIGIMNLLAELHQEHDLKLNLKFEIEVLCKNLSLELSQLNPGNLLKDYDKLGKMLQIPNFGVKHSNTSNTTTKSAIDHFAQSVQGGPHGLRKQPDTPSSGGISNSMNANSAAASLGIDISTSVNMQMVSSSGNMPMLPFNSLQHQHSGSMPLLGPHNNNNSNMMPNNSNNVMLQGPHSASNTNLVSLTEPAMSSSANDTMSQAQLLNQPPAGLTVPGTVRTSEPTFHFTEINTSHLNGIVPHISIDSRLVLVKEHPDLIHVIKLAIEKSIQEWMNPVIERSIKIALTTCEQIVKKDFALDHDENRIRASSHNMIRTLTAGMTMITCKDHLLLSIKNNLKHLIVTLTRSLSPQQTEAIEMTVNVIAQDNVELACAFIQKKAIEKAIPEIDKKLKSEYESRMFARKENRHHIDPVALAYQTERMPEPIRLRVGRVTQQQNAVYDEFARSIPGFKPLTDREMSAIAPKSNNLDVALPPSAAAPTPVLATSDECIAILEEVISKVEPFVQSCTGLPATPHISNLNALLEAMTRVRTTKEPGVIVILVEKAVENLLQGLTVQTVQVDSDDLARYRDANLLVLRAISDHRAYGQNWTNNRVTQALIDARELIRYNLDAFDCLIRSGLINLFEYDKHLANSMQNGDNSLATNFAMHICKIYLIDDRTNANIIESDLFGTIEVLQKIATQSPHPPEGISNLMEIIKMSSESLEQNLAKAGPTAQLHDGIKQAREFEDPPGLLEKTEYLLREWVNAYHSREAGKDSRQAFYVFVQAMNQHGILKTDELITRFFRMSTRMCVDLCYRALSERNNSPTLVRAKCFHTLDAYVRLITLLVKHSGDIQNTITKVNLLNKVLGIVAGVLMIDHDVRNTDFQQVPYHRIFIMLFLELNAPDQILENINYQVLTAYCNMLHILKPSGAPGFAYAWLEIVSHRVFMGRILASTSAQKGWPMYSQLLVDLFKFLSPFLRNAELAKPVHRLYRGTLRVLLVLLHDFPEFLCDYHYGFCDVIPPNCIQMRNLILSAFPRNMRLPDPFTPNLKVEMLPEISIAPRTVSNYAAMIKPSFKKDLDSYLKNRSPVSFLSEVRDNLLIGSGEQPGNRYNIQLINALVMHVGTQAITHIRAKGLTPNMSTIAHSSHMDIFQNLAVDLETEGRYLFLNCIANQLRYPNSHTHYFSCTLLYLFAEANTEAIQEQITRVLLERLIVNRPHPWGLLITFIELIKNPTFQFWQHEFVTCAPEIQKLFESVARSCMVHTLPPRNSNETELALNA